MSPLPLIVPAGIPGPLAIRKQVRCGCLACRRASCRRGSDRRRRHGGDRGRSVPEHDQVGEMGPPGPRKAGIRAQHLGDHPSARRRIGELLQSHAQLVQLVLVGSTRLDDALGLASFKINADQALEIGRQAEGARSPASRSRPKSTRLASLSRMAVGSMRASDLRKSLGNRSRTALTGSNPACAAGEPPTVRNSALERCTQPRQDLGQEMPARMIRRRPHRPRRRSRRHRRRRRRPTSPMARSSAS